MSYYNIDDSIQNYDVKYFTASMLYINQITACASARHMPLVIEETVNHITNMEL